MSSRRFAFLQREDIHRPSNGELYLRRIRIIETPWLGVYLHTFVRPDQEPELHDHPFSFLSLILLGSYEEELPVIASRPTGLTRLVRRRFLSWKRASQAHRIAYLHPSILGTVTTLVIRGPRKREWGFWTRTGWVQWRKYLGLDGGGAA